jgi:hypothetical protein
MTGATGTGTQGTQGLQGVTGNQGITGTGTQGTQGLQGRQGTTGSQGLTGTGIQGATGAQGTSGAQGSTGLQGLQGIQGRQGTTGLQGTKGTDGKSAGMRYIYLQNTGNFRPGATYFATNNATIANVTQIYIDYWDFYGERLDALLRTFDDSTSPIKGILYFNSLDNAKPGFGVFAVNSLVDNANYFVTLNVSFIAGSNLSAVTDMAMLFTRSGDQGGAGIQGTQGIQGRQGIQGLTGAGTQGTTGIQGYTGIQGLQGTQGLQGIQGFLGLQGFYGVQGLTGAQGLQGVSGTSGGDFWRRNGIQNIGLTDDYDKVSIGASSNPNSYKLNVWGTMGVSGFVYNPGLPSATASETKVVLFNPSNGLLAQSAGLSKQVLTTSVQGTVQWQYPPYLMTDTFSKTGYIGAGTKLYELDISGGYVKLVLNNLNLNIDKESFIYGGYLYCKSNLLNNVYKVNLTTYGTPVKLIYDDVNGPIASMGFDGSAYLYLVRNPTDTDNEIRFYIVNIGVGTLANYGKAGTGRELDDITKITVGSRIVSAVSGDGSELFASPVYAYKTVINTDWQRVLDVDDLDGSPWPVYHYSSGSNDYISFLDCRARYQTYSITFSNSLAVATIYAAFRDYVEGANSNSFRVIEKIVFVTNDISGTYPLYAVFAGKNSAWTGVFYRSNANVGTVTRIFSITPHHIAVKSLGSGQYTVVFALTGSIAVNTSGSSLTTFDVKDLQEINSDNIILGKNNLLFQFVHIL